MLNNTGQKHDVGIIYRTLASLLSKYRHLPSNKTSPSGDHCMKSIYSSLCYQQIPLEILSWFSLFFPRPLKTGGYAGISLVNSVSRRASLVFCFLLPPFYLPKFSHIGFFFKQRLSDWVALYLTVMVGHWLPSACYDYNDLGGARA